MKSRTILVLMLCGVIFSGCTSLGNTELTKETPQTISLKLIKGKTTKDNVLAMWSEPTSRGISTDGYEEWTYQYQKISPLKMVPIIGMMAGDVKGGALDIEFDKKGKVIKYWFDNSKF